MNQLVGPLLRAAPTRWAETSQPPGVPQRHGRLHGTDREPTRTGRDAGVRRLGARPTSSPGRVRAPLSPSGPARLRQHPAHSAGDVSHESAFERACWGTIRTCPLLPQHCTWRPRPTTGWPCATTRSRADGTRLQAWTNDVAGPTVLLCNGLGTNPYSWPGLLDPECGVRVISWNHRGTGGSERPADLEHVGIDAFAEDAIAVLDDAGIDACVLMGWSMGVNTMFEVAVRHPERVTGLFAVGGVPGDTFASMLAPIFVPRPIRKPITVNAARVMKLARQAPHPDRLAAARSGRSATRCSRTAASCCRCRTPSWLDVPSRSSSVRRSTGTCTSPCTPRSTCASRCGPSTCRPASWPGSSTSSRRRTTCRRRLSGSPGRPTRRSWPPTSSRWRSRPRCTRRCSTCSTASRRRPPLATLGHMRRLAGLVLVALGGLDGVCARRPGGQQQG